MPNENAPGLNIQYPQAGGTNPLETMANVIKLKDMMAQQELRKQQLIQAQAQTSNIQAQEEQRRRDLDSENSFTDLVKKNQGNYRAALDQLSKTGQASGTYLLQKGQAISAAEEQHLKKDSEQRAADKDILNKADAGFTGLKALPEDQRASQYSNLLSSWSKDPSMAPVLQKYMDANVIPPQYNEDALNALHLQTQGALSIANEAEKREQLQTAKASRTHMEAETAKLQAETPGAQAKSDVEVRKADALKSMTPQQWDDNVNQVVDPSAEPELNRRTKGLVKQALAVGDFAKAENVLKDASDQLGRTETAVRSAKATAPLKVNLAVNTAKALEPIKNEEAQNTAAARNRGQLSSSSLNEDDLKMEGQKYAITGQLETRLAPAVKNAIMHEGDSWARDNHMTAHDLAVAKAAFTGDTKALTTLKNTQASIKVAETTAGSNLDRFLDTMKNVKDTGSPIFNKPLRKIDERLLGKPEMAAMQTARQVATVEVGKVLSQVGGSGAGVLSDSARHEVSKLLDPDATMSQIYAAAKIIRADMKSRSDAYDTTIHSVTSNMAGGSVINTPEAPPDPNRPKLSDIFKKK